MSNINHNRPYLKYIDNLKREMGKAESSPRKIPSFPRKYKVTKNPSYIKKLDSISLLEIELDRIDEIMDLLTEDASLFIELLSTMRLGGKKNKRKRNTRRKKIEQIQSEIQRKMVSLSIELMASDLEQSSKGRKEGVFDWFNALGELMWNNGAEMGWETLDSIFTEASETVEKAVDEYVGKHNKASQGAKSALACGAMKRD